VRRGLARDAQKPHFKFMPNRPDIDPIHPAMPRLEALADLMDARFQIPGLPFKFGLDAIIGLLPVVGDTINLSISGYIVSEGIRLGAKKRDIIKMLFNIFLDWLIGLVPIIGDIFDVTWKGNLRNIRILQDRLRQEAQETGQKTREQKIRHISAENDRAIARPRNLD